MIPGKSETKKTHSTSKYRILTPGDMVTHGIAILGMDFTSKNDILMLEGNAKEIVD
jgi:hypothetical protein